MRKDPGSKNKFFDTSDIQVYLEHYANEVRVGLALVDKEALKQAAELMKAKRVFVGGNGGSAAISDHLACDFEKGAGRAVSSLSSRPALLSAIANDYGYQYTLSWQLEAANVAVGDSVVLISSSGNSPNIIEAAKFAKAYGAKVLGLTGFDGGALRRLADVSLHINVDNYGVVEDCHQALMHVLAQWHYLKSGS